jgi:hypothetical protein
MSLDKAVISKQALVKVDINWDNLATELANEPPEVIMEFITATLLRHRPDEPFDPASLFG